MKFSLIIPCYNESANLPLLLERCKPLEMQSGIEVILVDNGSTDRSPEVLQSLLPQYPGCRSIRVDSNQGYGYGFGILSGLKAAKGEILGWTHADMQTDPQDMLQAWHYLIATATTALSKDNATVVLSWMWHLPSAMAKPMWDINAQPTLFPRDFFLTWHSPPHDFSLDLYAYYQAQRQGLAVHRFPVKFGERAHGVSHWNVNWTAKWKFIRRTVDFSLQLKKNISA